jgi:class 3 adenylate cyclase/tetratricopeptide (TPR) repeat protein
MTFDEVLAQIIDLLKRQGRVSYPALKIRFSLDDNYLEAIKAEIIEAQQLATDENGRVLVWAENIAETSAVASPPAQPTPPLAVQQQPSLQVTPLPTVPPPDAERRQLTVMFCDLVESTHLSGRLDPEDLREVVRAYQQVCSEVITRFDGHIAQLLGDGLLVYFGYPQAHEDDALRATHTGLGILEAVEALNISLEPAKGITLAVRLGIHTGLVVVGDMGGAGRQEHLALGEVPNVASRIQGLAKSNTIIISTDTYRLIQGYFECQDLGVQTLRGVAEPITVYRVLRESGARGRLDVAHTRGLTPLVGRESEVTLLLERWQQAKAGQGQVVLVRGEGGIGKSRLVQVLKEHVAQEPHVCWECRSVPYYQHTALYPLTDLFQRTLQWQHDETPDEKLAKLEQALRQYRLPLEETVPLFAPLLSLPISGNCYLLLNLSPQRQRQKEITKSLLESGQLKALDGHYELTKPFSTFTIPSTLQDSLMARLDRLVTAKAVAQYAAVIGRQFSYELLQAVSQVDASTLQRELGRLVEAEIVYQRGVPPQAIYVFKHALLQDAAYEALLKSTRQQYHQQIAQVLEAQFPETAETQPELVAHHYTEAGLTEQAVLYWHKAGQGAIQRSAHVEAIAHLRQGLALLETLPETPQHLQREVDLLIAMGASLLAVQGYAASVVEQTYLRAHHLCQHLENPQQRLPVLRGLWIYYCARPALQTAYTLSEQFLTLAQQAQDPVMLPAAHRAVGTTLFFLGATTEAHTHFAQGIALDDPQQHHVAVLLYWGRRWGSVPQLCRVGAVVPGLS